ncbi:hypothetical protein [Sorangium sp. So ce854]|uniref:hypothetical protein n=1 Tax=Sorangium sp. So ce854 TaxID=3133322 RepID=UPI003F5FAC7D
MNSEKSGGTFPLQETEPKRLLGCLISTTSDTGPGWVHGSFSDAPGSMMFVDVGNKIELVLSRGVAFSLVGLLQVLVAQNAYIRDSHTRWTCEAVESGRIAVSCRPDPKGSIVASWVPDPERITCRVEQDLVEWRMREDMAMELAFALVRQLARVAAGVEAKSA